MIVPLADRLEAIVTFAFDESRGTLGAFEVEAFEVEVFELNEAETSEELELVSTLEA
ncbi:hypothetical protein LK337_0669 [Lactococcus lactis subsp. lactis]|nr:hypothetical protein LK337_0669 [Lactococcus lactis subsp. lactis]